MLAADPMQFDLALSSLRRLSLLHRQAHTHTLVLHRLVQMVLRVSMDAQDQRRWLSRIIAALNALFPDDASDVQAWDQCERLLPQVFACASVIPSEEADATVVQVMRKAADYLRRRAQYAQAEQLYRRALRIGEQRFFAHADMIALLTGLGFISRVQGNSAEAESLYQRALQFGENEEVSETLIVTNPLNNLAILYAEQGKYVQAELLFQRVLRIREQTGGCEHLSVVGVLNNLAALHYEQGAYDKAELLFQRALQIGEQRLGSEHPEVAHPLTNLADIYSEQGKNEQADAFYHRALHIWEQWLGPDHPKLAHPLNGLGTNAFKQGKNEQADAFYQRALSIREQVLGPDHVETAQTLYDLALFYQQQKKQGQAIALAQRAHAIRVHTLGESHAKTVAAHVLAEQLVQEQTNAHVEGMTTHSSEEKMDVHSQKEQGLQRGTTDPSVYAEAQVRAFLDAFCLLHPCAWSRASDLWHAYERWVEEQQDSFPLSRRVWAAQLRALGLHSDRTNTARIWRGIALIDEQTGDAK